LNYEQHKFSLRFKDHNLEKDYWLQKNDSLKKDVKNGLIQSLVLWSIGAGSFYYTNPEEYLSVSIAIISTVYPIFTLMLILLNKDSFRLHIHTIAVISNFVAASLVIYVGFVVPNKLYPVMVALIFVIFFGLYLYRFNKVSTIVIVCTYSFVFLLLILTISNREALDLTGAIMFSFFFPVFVITAYHSSVNKAHQLFLY